MPTFEEQQAELRKTVPKGTPGALELEKQGFTDVGIAPTGFNFNMSSTFNAGDMQKAIDEAITSFDISKFLTDQKDLLSKLAETQKLTPEQEAATKELGALKLKEVGEVEALRTRPGFDLPTFGRAVSEQERTNRLRKIELQQQLQLAELKKTNLVESLKTQLEEKRTMTKDVLDLLKLATGSSIGTFTDDEGNVTALIRNPLTGQITPQKIVGIGKKATNKEFTNTNWVTGPDNKLTFVGRTTDGEIISEKTDITVRAEGGFGPSGMFTAAQVQNAIEEATRAVAKFGDKRVPITDPSSGEIKMGLPSGLRERVIQQLKNTYGKILTESQIVGLVFDVLPDFVTLEETDADIGDIIKSRVLKNLEKPKPTKP